MATEPNLRHLFSAPQPPGGIDVETVLRRSRARRVPKLLGAMSVSVLAIGGLVFGGVQVGLAGLGTTASLDSAGSAPEAGSDAGTDGAYDSAKAPYALAFNACGAPAVLPTSASDIAVTVAFPDSAMAGQSVEGTVTLTNTGSGRLTGYAGAAPLVTLAQDDAVVWHSGGANIAADTADVNLGPGESIHYVAEFEARACTADDEKASGLSNDLPPAEPGEYQLIAAIAFTRATGEEILLGTTQTIRVR